MSTDVKFPTMLIEATACMCHEVNRVYCESLGDHTQLSWEKAEDWQRSSAIKGVEFALSNPGISSADQHDAWVAYKVREGWTFGLVKDAVKKTHPCLVPYTALPAEQQVKDVLFQETVKFALSCWKSLVKGFQGEFRRLYGYGVE
jgi:hypothetical protein